MNINKRLEQMSVSSKYGAPMGRSHVMNNDQASVYLQRVEFVDGDYDRGGAYWGGGRDSLPLWCAMDEEAEVLLFTRASTKEKAKQDILVEYPDLTFIEANDIDVDEFTRHYLIAALWSSTDDDGDAYDSYLSIEDIDPDYVSKTTETCRKFIEENKDDLLTWNGRWSVEEIGGHDLWLTRNRHGSGFWDGDWGDEVGKRLTEAAHKLGETYLYINDEGMVCGE